ncbi:MAG: hypothetical protein J6V90_08160 [Treponema sp.]|nr:hypothetical protein [Treponema sp.]
MLNEEIFKVAAAEYAAKKSGDAKIRKMLEDAYMEGVGTMSRLKTCYKKRTPEELDKRVKLPKAKREELVSLRKKMGYTYETLAQMFGISNTYAQALCKPDLMRLIKHNAALKHKSESKEYKKAIKQRFLARRAEYAIKGLI